MARKKRSNVRPLHGSDVRIHDSEHNPYEIEPATIADALKYLKDAIPCEVTFYDGKAIGIEPPATLVREVEYTEPAVRGDTSGKVMKRARLKGSG